MKLTSKYRLGFIVCTTKANELKNWDKRSCALNELKNWDKGKLRETLGWIQKNVPAERRVNLSAQRILRKGNT